MKSQSVSIENLKRMIKDFAKTNKTFHEFGVDKFSAYFIGSLAHGGFSEFCSDIDLACVFSDDVNVDTAKHIVSEFQKIILPFSTDRLSVFWGTPTSINTAGHAFGRFPEIDKLDLIEYGEVFFGQDCRSNLIKPLHQTILIDSCRFAIERLFKDKNIFEKILDPALMMGDVRLLTKLILFPARFIYTAETAHVATNDIAVDYFVRTKNCETGMKQLLQDAQKWRMMGKIENQTEALRSIRKYLIQFYRLYIQIYFEFMRKANESGLIGDLNEWQSALN